MTDKEVTVKLTKSLIGSKDFQKNSVRGLGLFKLGQTVSVKDTPENRLKGKRMEPVFLGEIVAR